MKDFFYWIFKGIFKREIEQEYDVGFGKGYEKGYMEGVEQKKMEEGWELKREDLYRFNKEA